MALGEFHDLLHIGCELRQEEDQGDWWGICNRFDLRVRADTKGKAYDALQGLMIRAIRIGVEKMKDEAR